MRRTAHELEARLEKVERELAELKATLPDRSATPWWKEIAGTFAGDSEFAEITRLGRLIRRGKLKK